MTSQGNRPTTTEIRDLTYKSRDAWWTVLLVDPLAVHLVRLFAPYRWITPNRLTVTAFVFGMVAAVCFALADWRWLIVGAVIYHASFVLDCVDGKLARLQGSGSIFGTWLDFIFDRVRVIVCTFALFGGAWAATDNSIYLFVAAFVVALAMFRYVNASAMSKIKSQMRTSLEEAYAAGADGDGQRVAFLEEVVDTLPEGDEDAAPARRGRDEKVVDLDGDFRSRWGSFVRIRNSLIRHRIRLHLVSGIEFEMAVFIVAPLTGLLIGVPIGAGVLLLVFEAALVYKLWLSTRAFTRRIARITASEPDHGAGAAPAAGPGESAEGSYAGECLAQN